jgi:hypothetical protein
MKRTILYAILFPVLLMAVVLFLYSFRALENPVKPAEIPEGWEVVSNEDDCVYIRMKEGADSYVWVEHRADDDFYLDVCLPGGKDHVSTPYDSEKTIPVIVYFGYGKRAYDAESGNYYINPNLAPQKYSDYQLIMRRKISGRYFSTLLLDLPNFTGAASVNCDGENKIGYTNGVIVNVPANFFENAKNRSLEFSLRAKGESDINENASVYFTHDVKRDKMIVETKFDAWDDDHQYAFPQNFTNPGIMTITGNWALLLSIAVFTLLSLIRKKGYAIPYLYIALALILNLGMTIWLDMGNTGNFDLSWLLFYAALIIYLPLAGILGVVQFFVTWIQKCIAKRKGNKLSSMSVESDEIR